MEVGCMLKVFYRMLWKQLFQCKIKRENTVLSEDKIA